MPSVWAKSTPAAKLSSCGMSIPATFEELVIDCLQLAQAGVQPIANALSEWPEVALDCAASMGAPDGSYGSQESLDGAVNVLNSLVLVGAFGSDPWNVTDQDMEEQFLGGQAAMRFDTSDLASLIPEDRAGQYAVISLPGMDGTERTALVGSPDCGLAMTRACYDDPVRREAAISFIRKLLEKHPEVYGRYLVKHGDNGGSVATADGEISNFLANHIDALQIIRNGNAYSPNILGHFTETAAWHK